MFAALLNTLNIFVLVPVNIHGLKAHFDGTEILSPGNSNFRRTINKYVVIKFKCRN